MFVAGQSIYAGMIFSLLSFMVAVPSAIKVFNWTATLYKGSISFETPMLYALGFIGLFTIGGLTGLFLAALAVDVHVHDTYFVIAHFHYIMVGGMVMAYMGGMHFWWPKMTGRMYPEGWAKVGGADHFPRIQSDILSAVHAGISRNAAALSHVSAGVSGASMSSQRRARSFWESAIYSRMVYFLWSLGYGKRAGSNPWDAKGLEWITNSPPPAENFAITPIVDEPAYNYGNPANGQATIS